MDAVGFVTLCMKSILQRGIFVMIAVYYSILQSSHCTRCPLYCCQLCGHLGINRDGAMMYRRPLSNRLAGAFRGFSKYPTGFPRVYHVTPLLYSWVLGAHNCSCPAGEALRFQLSRYELSQAISRSARFDGHWSDMLLSGTERASVFSFLFGVSLSHFPLDYTVVIPLVVSSLCLELVPLSLASVFLSPCCWCLVQGLSQVALDIIFEHPTDSHLIVVVQKEKDWRAEKHSA